MSPNPTPSLHWGTSIPQVTCRLLLGSFWLYVGPWTNPPAFRHVLKRAANFITFIDPWRTNDGWATKVNVFSSGGSRTQKGKYISLRGSQTSNGWSISTLFCQSTFGIQYMVPCIFLGGSWHLLPGSASCRKPELRGLVKLQKSGTTGCEDWSAHNQWRRTIDRCPALGSSDASMQRIASSVVVVPPILIGWGHGPFCSAAYYLVVGVNLWEKKILLSG
jgi:hypothetical protein